MAQIARRHNLRIDKITNGNLTASASSSDKAVLLAELLRESERRLLRAHLTSDEQCLTANLVYRINLRVLWRPEAQLNPSRRAGRFVVFIHACSGRLTSSWAFIKFAKPFYEAGFSVILFDLPGFGKSSVSGKVFAPRSEWVGDDNGIIVLTLENIGVESANFVVHSDSAMIAMKLIINTPQVVQGQMILWNPSVNLAGLFETALALPGMRPKDEHEQFSELLKKRRMRIMALFEQPTSDAGWKSMDVFSKCGTNAWPNVKVGRLLPDDAVIAQAGAKVNVDIIMPSKHMVSLFVQHLSESLETAWNVSPMERPPFQGEALHISSQEDTNQMEESEPQAMPALEFPQPLRRAWGAPAITGAAWTAEATAGANSTAIVPVEMTQALGQGQGSAAERHSTSAPAALPIRGRGGQAQTAHSSGPLPLMDRPVSQGAKRRPLRGGETDSMRNPRHISAASMHVTDSVGALPSSTGNLRGLRVSPGTRVRWEPSEKDSAMDSVPAGSTQVTMQNSAVWAQVHRYRDPEQERHQLLKNAVAKELASSAKDYNIVALVKKSEQPFTDEETKWVQSALAESRITNKEEFKIRCAQSRVDAKFAQPPPADSPTSKHMRLSPGADKIRAVRDRKKTAEALRSNSRQATAMSLQF